MIRDRECSDYRAAMSATWTRHHNLKMLEGKLKLLLSLLSGGEIS